MDQIIMVRYVGMPTSKHGSYCATYFFQTIDADRINGNSILISFHLRGHKIDFVQMGLDWLLGLFKGRRSGDLILIGGCLTRKNSGSVLGISWNGIGSKDDGSGTQHLLQDLSSFYRICCCSRSLLLLLIGLLGVLSGRAAPRNTRWKQQKENEECIALGHDRNICSELGMRAMYDTGTTGNCYLIVDDTRRREISGQPRRTTTT